MIICPQCNKPLINSQCDNCDFRPTLVDGFEAWAPELANQAGGQFFDPESFRGLASLEAGNFWFRMRNCIIIWAIKHYCGNPSDYAEIGCGTGFVLSAVAEHFPGMKITGSELFTRGLGFASERVPTARLIQLDARKIPYRDEFDVVGIFDVLEHIEEDIAVLKSINLALVKNGFMVLTVPQHPWLWSWTDEEACHVRRYNRSELHTKIQNAGFEIVRSTSFVTLLLPLMMFSRLFSRGRPEDPYAELKLNAWLNRTLELVLGFELSLIRAHISLPVGGSRLIIAKKVNYDSI